MARTLGRNGARRTGVIVGRSRRVSRVRGSVRELYLGLLLRRRPITESLEEVSTTLGVVASVRHVKSRASSVTRVVVSSG